MLHKFSKYSFNYFNIPVRSDFDHPDDKHTYRQSCTKVQLLWLSTQIAWTCRKKTNYICGVSVLMSGVDLETEARRPADPAECWHQKQTEEISHGTESTNSCQPSQRYRTGSAVVRTTERKWEGTDGHAPFGWQTAKPWERCGTDSFL